MSTSVPSRLHSYSFRVPTQWVCVGTTPTYLMYAYVAGLLVASLYF